MLHCSVALSPLNLNSNYLKMNTPITDKSNIYLKSKFIDSFNQVVRSIPESEIITSLTDNPTVNIEDFIVSEVLRLMKYSKEANINLAKLIFEKIENFNNSPLDKQSQP